MPSSSFEGRLKRVAWIGSCCFLSLLAGSCGSEDALTRSRGEAPPDRRTTIVDETATTSAATIEEFGPPDPTLSFEMPRTLRLEATGTLPFRVVNEQDRPGTVVIDMYGGSERGPTQKAHVIVRDVGPGSALDLELTAAELALPSGNLEVPAYIHLDGTVRYVDGTTSRVSAAGLYVEPQEGGGWEIYDEAARLERPFGGAISARARDTVARLPKDTTLVPAYYETAEAVAATRESDGAELPPADAVAHPLSAEAKALVASQLAEHRGLLPTPAKTRAPGETIGAVASALTVSSTLCATMTSNFIDASTGDAYTGTGDVNRTVIGMQYTVQGPCNGTTCPATIVSQGTLGDGFSSSVGQGCTPTKIALTAGSTYLMTVWTAGTIGGNNISTTDFRVSNNIASIAFFVSLPASPPSTVWFNATPIPGLRDTAQNAYQALAYGLSVYPGLSPLNNTVFHIVNGGGGAYSCWSDTVDFNNAMAQMKFTLGHELGHAVHFNGAGFARTNCGAAANDYTDQGNGEVAGSAFPGWCNTVVPAGTPDGHGVFSREWSSAAMIEGFADYYSAAVFNNAFSQSDCGFMQLGTQFFDCEGETTEPDRFMLRTCNAPPGDWARDRGTEWDWFKLFWDVRTNASSSTRPTMNNVLRWVADADNAQPWTRSNVFNLMDLQANVAGQVASLRDTWNVSKLTTGANGAPVVFIRSNQNNLYVASELGYTGDAYATLRARTAGNAVGPWELFQVFTSNLANGDKTLLSVGNNLFVTAEQSLSNGVLRARATQLGPWEQFLMQRNADSSVSFFARSRNLWVAAEVNTDQSLHARTSPPIGPWEKFALVDGNFISP